MARPDGGRVRIYRQTLMLRAFKYYMKNGDLSAAEMREYIRLINDTNLYTKLEVEAWYKDLNVERIKK